MKLQIHATNFSADEKLLHFVQKKMDKLDTFYKHNIDGEIFLRLNNESINNKTTEIKLHVPGTHLFAKEHGASFEEAIDKTAEALKRQLRKFKEKNDEKRG